MFRNRLHALSFRVRSSPRLIASSLAAMPDEETPLVTDEPTPEGEAPAPAPGGGKKKKKKGEDEDEGGVAFEDMTDEQKAEYMEHRASQPEDIKQYRAASTGLMNGRVIWSGEVSTDFLFFLQNTHVVLAIFRSHRIHPMRMWQRVVFLLDTLGFAFWTSVFITDHATVGLNAEYVALVILAGVLAFILAEILVLLAVCPCTMAGHAYAKTQIAGKRAKVVCKPIGKVALWVATAVILFLSLYFGITGIHGGTSTVEEVMATWGISQVTGWITAVGSASPTFLYAWYTQREAFEGKEEDHTNFEPGLGPAYPSWKFMQLTQFGKLEELKGATKEACLAEIEAHAKKVAGDCETPAPAPEPAN